MVVNNPLKNVTPSKIYVLQEQRLIKKKFHCPKSTISEVFHSYSPLLIKSNNIYLSKGPKLSWDPESDDYMSTNLKGLIFKWVPKQL